MDFADMDFDGDYLSKLTGTTIPTMSEDEVREIAKSRVSSLMKSYDELNSILMRHEATIQKRWIKKKKKQRLEVITKAWGTSLPATHRPDYAAAKKESPAQRDRGSAYVGHYMWPHITQEDLLKTKSLLLLLNSRGHHHPSAFAGADLGSMRLGIVSNAFNRIFLNGFVMIIQPSKEAGEYGRLLSWDDHEDAFDWMHTQYQAIPGDGLLILEAQEKLLQFLLDVCSDILHDIPADSLIKSFAVQPTPSLESDKSSEGFQTLAVMALEAPYRLPNKMDIDRVEALLRAKRTAAEDHIWSLREDPGYFEQHMRELKEHKGEMIKDRLGNLHPTLTGAKQSLFWTRVVSGSIFAADFELEVFAQLHRRAEKLQTILAECEGKLLPEKPLTDHLLHLLLEFQYFLNRAAVGPMQVLKETVPASPPWRNQFVREVPPDTKTSKMSMSSNPRTKLSRVETELRYLLSTVWDNGQQLFLLGLPLVLDELERLIETEPAAKQLLTEHVLQTIGSLSIISQCLKQLDLFQPWSRTFENLMAEENREDKMQKAMDEAYKPWAEIQQGFSEKGGPSHATMLRFASLFDPTDGKFSYPSGKRRTKQNTDALVAAEKKLDSFWEFYDRLARNASPRIETTAVGKLLKRPRALRRTAEWVEPPPSAGKGQETASDPVAPIYKPFSALYIDEPAAAKSASQSTAATKAKVKTKGQAAPSPAEPDAPEVVEAEAEAVPPIPVDAKALKTFRMLFFDPSVTLSAGEVSWTDFVHAMTSSGVFSAEKMYGSVWQFQRIDGRDQSRIQFHEPHPHYKIPFFTARRHGRRLNRNYGWTLNSFVLKENTSA